jgi:serine/threonine protein kinase
VRNDGSPLLIDFGAARQQFSAEGLKLPPSYTPGFAAPEQHGGGAPLGPWTDVYAVGATLYACFAAGEPQPADARLKDDRLVPARRAWNGKYSPQLLETVDWCLKLSHLDRPQSVFALQKALIGESGGKMAVK